MSEILVAAFIAVLVYSATRIPALGDALGRAVRGPPPEPPPGGVRDTPGATPAADRGDRPAS